MTRPLRVTRRRFLGATAAAAGGIALPAAVGRSVETAAIPADCASTEHFWYRPQPKGLFVDSQCGNRALAYTDGVVLLSEDNGRTWPHRAAFPDARRIVFSCIFQNGNVLFSALAKLYLSTDNLKTFRQITVKKADGSDYHPHTPKNSSHPGWYFHCVSGVNTWEIHGAEILVWGNYCNVIGGAAPVNIYYSTDQGQTVKIAYSFGQNPFNRDDGSGAGGEKGTLLGDPDNPVICRHIHCVAYNPPEDAFYACTGDFDRPQGHECHWLRGTYDAGNDQWRWKVIVSDVPNSRYKSGAMAIVEGMLYWCSDSNCGRPDYGIFRCAPADLANPKKHVRVFDPGMVCGQMIIQDGVILASHCAPESKLATGFFISPDMGQTWAQYDLKEFGKRTPNRYHRKNGEGWFRVDLRSGWVDPAEMMFIKPKKLRPPSTT